MNINTPLPLLAGLSPHAFMRTHWQKKPLLIRQAIPGFAPLLSRSELFALAGQEGVESRLVQCKTAKGQERWRMDSGPFAVPAQAQGAQAKDVQVEVAAVPALGLPLPPLSRKLWTLLVQGVDLHHDGVHALLQNFRFVPDARLDDLMISYATEGGGVGPHFDSYDVFLLQAQGRRRWRIGAQKDLTLREGLPLKVLQNFAPTQEFVLEPGDMLYLPPRWAHEGVAEGGECQTYSIGFRAPSASELARELLTRLADVVAQEAEGQAARLYTDRQQAATAQPATLPPELATFAHQALATALKDKQLMQQLLGEALTEPKAKVWFEASRVPKTIKALRLDRASRMLVDGKYVFLNGESWRMGGADAKLLRKLAHSRALDATDLIATNAQNKRLAAGLPSEPSADFMAIVRDWAAQGWVHAS